MNGQVTYWAWALTMALHLPPGCPVRSAAAQRVMGELEEALRRSVSAGCPRQKPRTSSLS
jgi:hypothetical protein